MAVELQKCLFRFPKIESLKPEQKEALEFLLSGRDVLAILPTGFGTSLIYQVFCQAKLAVFKSEEYAIERRAFGFSIVSFPGEAVLVALLELAECGETDIPWLKPFKCCWREMKGTCSRISI